ncbi:enoyl-CoA-hydratase DpgB [Granulicella sp. L60]|uniref:enoyl-CoA-hydratase DpgB n=1 Tax=Granulicella sp. L60 TaxID=1641866 RepID=UPI00131C87A5|nr:enoyl-CoA-hydratase DpgB [Granulicella sp. L60]
MLPTFLDDEDGTIVKVQIHGYTQISTELISQITDTLDRAEDVGSTRIIVVQVTGAAESSSIDDWPGQISTGLVNKWERLLRRAERASPILIVVAQQVCSPLALELLLVADCRLCTDDFVVEKKFSNGSIWPSMATYRLSRQIGETRARKLLMDESNIGAFKAQEMDLIDKVFEASTDMSAHLAHFLERAPLNDFAVRRRLMQDSLSTTYEEALGAHLAACDRALRRAQTKNNVSNDTQNAPQTAHIEPPPGF